MPPPMRSAPPRAATAILIASQASSASGCSPVAAPSSRREYRSITVARYSLPAAVGISVVGRAGARYQTFVLVRFPGPPSEPDVPVSEHPALHRPMPSGQAAVWVGAVQGSGILFPR